MFAYNKNKFAYGERGSMYSAGQGVNRDYPCSSWLYYVTDKTEHNNTAFLFTCGSVYDCLCRPGYAELTPLIGHRREKTCLRGLRTTKAQTSLRIRAV